MYDARLALSSSSPSQLPDLDSSSGNSSFTLPEPPPPNFEIGDHIYTWCRIPGVPVEQAYQHHGIVMGLGVRHGKWIMKIADFSFFAQRSEIFNPYRNGPEEETVEHGLRTHEVSANDANWFKVDYQASAYSSPTHSSPPPQAEEDQIEATTSSRTNARCDEPALVFERIQFLISCPEAIPSYNLLEANCECVAVWCKTGTWATLQVISCLSQLSEEQQDLLWNVAQQAVQTRLMGGLWSAPASAATALFAKNDRNKGEFELDNDENNGTDAFAPTGITPEKMAVTSSFAAAANATTAATATGLSAWWAAYALGAVVTPKLLLWHTEKQWQAMTEDLNIAFWGWRVTRLTD